jgi:TonB family protein
MVTTELELTPGALPGAEDCLGPGQTFSSVLGDLVPLAPGEPPYADGPILISQIEPIYPRSALARGVADTLAVRAYVCRTGRVLSAFVHSESSHDPKLVEAAIAAFRQYVFTPAKNSSGEPMAAWVETVVFFKP